MYSIEALILHKVVESRDVAVVDTCTPDGWCFIQARENDSLPNPAPGARAESATRDLLPSQVVAHLGICGIILTGEP